MQIEEQQLSNNVQVNGIIVTEPVFSHSLYGESFYTFTVSVKRLSDKYDILPITISERLIDIDKLEENIYVYIDGQIRSYNNYDDSEKRNKLIITIFARSIDFINEVEAFSDRNDIILNGFICKSPIYRTTPFGREIADILLAVNRSYNKSDYIPCIAWGRNAKYCDNLAIGSNVKITGRLQSRHYQKKFSETDIVQKIAYEISITKIELLSAE